LRWHENLTLNSRSPTTRIARARPVQAIARLGLISRAFFLDKLMFDYSPEPNGRYMSPRGVSDT
jgi:hypothetical protein